jgi:cytochrome c biogenesis protein CcmG/thiol:disulfide interchange protein DsbE
VIIVGAVIAVALGVALTLIATHTGSTGSTPAVAVSTDPASFDLPRLAGAGDVRLSSYRGRPTVVNFFASWCTACQFELPGYATVSRELSGRVNFVGVNSLETGDGLAMAHRFGIDTWPLARDVNGQHDSGLHDALGSQGMPISAFYDASGKLLYVSPGALPEPDLRALIQRFFGIT